MDGAAWTDATAEESGRRRCGVDGGCGVGGGESTEMGVGGDGEMGERGQRQID